MNKVHMYLALMHTGNKVGREGGEGGEEIKGWGMVQETALMCMHVCVHINYN